MRNKCARVREIRAPCATQEEWADKNRAWIKWEGGCSPLRGNLLQQSNISLHTHTLIKYLAVKRSVDGRSLNISLSHPEEHGQHLKLQPFHFFPLCVRHSLPGFPFLSRSLNFSSLPTKAPKPSRLKLLLWSRFLLPESDGHTNLHSSRSHGLNVKLSAGLKNNATSRTPLLEICIRSSAKAVWNILFLNIKSDGA